MTYLPLGSRRVAATADPDTGNWLNAFTGSILAMKVPFFEWYRGVVESAPAGASAVIKVGALTVSFTAPGPGGGSVFSPPQPVLLIPSQEIYFYWTATAAGTAPVVTLWFRYDPAIPNNPKVPPR